MSARSFDSIVIGGGSAGLAFAKRAAKHGARIALVEKAELGGTCVNRGCVPKKLMWETANNLRSVSLMVDNGLADRRVLLDFPRLRERIDAKIESLRGNFSDAIEEAGITLIRGDAVVQDDTTVSVEAERYEASHIVLATGASPDMLDIDNADLLDTSEDILSLDSVPARLLVLGGGYIGCEFAAIFRALGSEVILVTDIDRLLPEFEEAGTQVVAQNMEIAGVDIRYECRLDSIRRTGNALQAKLSDGTEVRIDRALCAIGRTPHLDGLGEYVQDLARADSGALMIDERFRTSRERIHAIGDIADRLPLTPVARHDGHTLADQLFGENRAPIPLQQFASAAFVMPPIAQIGMPSQLHDAQTHDAHTTPLQADVVGDQCAFESCEFHRFHHDEDTGALLGATVIAPAAPDMIAMIGTAIQSRVRRADLERVVAVHPGFAEEVLPDL